MIYTTRTENELCLDLKYGPILTNLQYGQHVKPKILGKKKVKCRDEWTKIKRFLNYIKRMLKIKKIFKNVAHGGLIDFILGITHLITSHHGFWV